MATSAVLCFIFLLVYIINNILIKFSVKLVYNFAMGINRRTFLILGLGIVVLCSIYFLESKNNIEDDDIFCTMEALMCPDGSYVGRSGPKCEFSACPNKDFFVGELGSDSAGYRLIIAAPNEAINSATYAMPLDLKASNVVGQFLGQQVKVRGVFSAGNRLEVSILEEATREEAGLKQNEGIIGIGETKLLKGIKITLNSVVQDNRCPVDAECIEGGAITANVTFMSDTDKETFNMPSDEVPRGFDAWQVSIIGVKPSRISAKDPDPNSYQVTFRVEDLSGNR